ncbi:hypothetical protein FQ192_11740 [Pseudomonas sp. ANT_J12]|uniref:hypothetical protein n=1 Tax=Pseudomonas sp. ANT_J12 TaxID=2597351 RepID=UPI0011F1007B|nr:hypothetical protein [Pseudomonas sp. ANT_J12]KAA0994801.1 hypothetical protein FQ192_11740 [Pseudomonas sp. ANT_J12]
MFSKQDLLGAFAVVDEDDSGHYFFQHNLPKTTYWYCLKSSADQDVLIVSEDVNDRQFATAVLDQSPEVLFKDKPTLFKISENVYGFTHAFAVPNNYHGSLKGNLDSKRDKLFLCVPIFRCEFSGGETEKEFKDMAQRMLPVFKWKRDVYPKLRVYFDNPKTGAGTYEAGALLKIKTLVAEVENLNGVISGFVEITNYKGDVIEILSPAKDEYKLIRNRSVEEVMDFCGVAEKLFVFSKGE